MTKTLEPSGSAGGATGLALIVGNSAYTALPPLMNAVPDAKAIASAAQGLGYRVSLVEGGDRLGMNRAISDFLAQVEAESEVLFYYAAHGVELSGANYLFPTDVPMLKVAEERLLRSQTINLPDLLLDFEAQGPRHAGHFGCMPRQPLRAQWNAFARIDARACPSRSSQRHIRDLLRRRRRNGARHSRPERYLEERRLYRCPLEAYRKAGRRASLDGA